MKYIKVKSFNKLCKDCKYLNQNCSYTDCNEEE